MEEVFTAHKRMLLQVTDGLTFKLTLFAAPALVILKEYLYNDIQFLIYLAIMMVLDLITGIWVAVKAKKAITSIGLRQTATKSIQYGIFLIVVHTMTHFTVAGHTVKYFLWLNDIAYSFLMVIECKSILENMVKIDNRFNFLKGIIDKLKSFTKQNDPSK